MPSTRSSGDTLMGPLDASDDDYDPDYDEEESAGSDDEIPKTMGRDRAKWIEDNVEDIEWLYRKLLEDGRSVMGQAFLQTGSITSFAKYLYKNTTPFSEH